MRSGSPSTSGGPTTPDAPSDPSVCAGPQASDWLALLLGLGFSGAGVGLLVVGDAEARRAGLVTLLFFGACTAVFVSTIIDKRRRAEALDGAPTTPVPSGERIAMARGRAAGLALGFVLLGGVGACVGLPGAPPFAWISALLAAVGVAMLVALALGRTCDGWLCLDEDALAMGDRRLSWRVAYGDVDAVALGDLAGNAVVMIRIADTAAALASVLPDEPAARARLARRLAWTRRWNGDWDVVIQPAHYALDPVGLLRAIEQRVGARA